MITFLLEFPQKCCSSAGIPEKRERRSALNPLLLVGIIVVLIAQASMLLYWGSQKDGFHVDEVYTYELANYQYTNYGDVEGAYGNWISGEALKTIAEPDGTELFNLTIPYWNSETDNHPPEYYIIVHILSSIFKILNIHEIKWAGLIPNFIACLFTTAILILIGYALTHKAWPSIVMGAFWAFSIGAIHTGIYLRMYALLTFWCVLFTYLHLLFYQKMAQGSLDRRFMSAMLICTTAGVLSQYYFLIFTFFMCAVTFMILFVKRNLKLLLSYCAAEFSGVLLAKLFFPRMLVRLLFGDRGAEALHNAVSADLMAKVKEAAAIINHEIFSGYGAAVLTVRLVVFLIGIVVTLTRKEQITLETLFVWQPMLVSAMYVVVIAKLAPYMVNRYFMCSFPIILLCCAYSFYRGIELIIRSARSAQFAACILTSSALMIIVSGYSPEQIQYVYTDHAQRRAAIDSYGDIPVVTVNADSYHDSALKWLFELQHYSDIFMCHHHQFSDLVKASQDGKLDEGFLLYGHMYEKDDHLIDEVKKYIPVSDDQFVTDIGGCIVYYIQ